MKGDRSKMRPQTLIKFSWAERLYFSLQRDRNRICRMLQLSNPIAMQDIEPRSGHGSMHLVLDSHFETDPPESTQLFRLPNFDKPFNWEPIQAVSQCHELARNVRIDRRIVGILPLIAGEKAHLTDFGREFLKRQENQCLPFPLGLGFLAPFHGPLNKDDSIGSCNRNGSRNGLCE